MSRGWAWTFLIMGVLLIVGGFALVFHGDGPVSMPPLVIGGIVTGSSLRELGLKR